MNKLLLFSLLLSTFFSANAQEVASGGCEPPTGIVVWRNNFGAVTFSFDPPETSPTFGYQYYCTSGSDIPSASQIPSGSVPYWTETVYTPGKSLEPNYCIWLRKMCDTEISEWASGCMSPLHADSFNNDVEQSIISVFPNPANEFVTIAGLQTIRDVRVFNIIGQEVMSQRTNANEVQLNVSGLSSGKYILKIDSGEGLQTLTFVKNDR